MDQMVDQAPPPPPQPQPPPAFSPTADAGLLARIDALFRAVDIDRSGEIDLSELRNYFGDVCEPLLRELDSIVVDGEVSEEEWRAFFELYLRPGMGGRRAAEDALKTLEDTVKASNALGVAQDRMAAYARKHGVPSLRVAAACT